METSLTIAMLEAEVATRITALNTSPGTADYKHGTVTAAWNESSVPLTVEFDGSALGHLGFMVAADDSPNSGEGRAEAGWYAKQATRLPVMFAYELRPTEQRADFRLASTAGLDVVKALMADWRMANVELDNAGRRLLSGDGRWGLVTLLFTVRHDLPL